MTRTVQSPSRAEERILWSDPPDGVWQSKVKENTEAESSQMEFGSAQAIESGKGGYESTRVLPLGPGRMLATH